MPERVIEMAWEDRTPFDAIAIQFGLNESAVIALMRKHLKRSSFALWRKRVAGRATKHRMIGDAKQGRSTHRTTPVPMAKLFDQSHVRHGQRGEADEDDS